MSEHHSPRAREIGLRMAEAKTARLKACPTCLQFNQKCDSRSGLFSISRVIMSSSNPFQADPRWQSILSAAEELSWVWVSLNGEKMFLPTGTLLTMAHCLALESDASINLDVEAAHLRWMQERLAGGSVFLDVGAATGAMTLPISKATKGIQIIAFEPAVRARRLLQATLTKNGFYGVNVLPLAVSDRVGTVQFADREISENGECPFLPETSSIVSADTQSDPHGKIETVETTTLDAVGKEFGLNGRNIVIKIDIEGYEVEALIGAQSLLASNKVALAIDIHEWPGHSGTTEKECRRLLEAAGYTCYPMMGHVLLAERA
jgi:FkbM family methyltransferase